MAHDRFDPERLAHQTDQQETPFRLALAVVGGLHLAGVDAAQGDVRWIADARPSAPAPSSSRWRFVRVAALHHGHQFLILARMRLSLITPPACWKRWMQVMHRSTRAWAQCWLMTFWQPLGHHPQIHGGDIAPSRSSSAARVATPCNHLGYGRSLSPFKAGLLMVLLPFKCGSQCLS